MIYLVDKRHAYTVTAYMATDRGRDLPIRILSYQDATRLRALPADTYVFSDMDRLGPARLAWATALWDVLASAGRGLRLLNDPRRLLMREALLRRLAEAGGNDFRVFKPGESRHGMRFPVFVREACEHTGSLTKLIEDEARLDAALHRLTSHLGGYRPDDLLVVEYCDTRNEEGVYVKYSAYRIGDAIIPCYVMTADHWMVKGLSRRIDEHTVAREIEYMRTNPHESWLREVFAFAGIDYGRIDYGVHAGRPQVWEINTNPTIGPTRDLVRWIGNTRPERLRAIRQPVRDLFDPAFRAAVEAIDGAPVGGPPIENTCDPALTAAARSEWVRQRPRELYEALRSAARAWRDRRRKVAEVRAGEKT